MEKNITVRLTARLFAEEKCYGPGVEQLLKAVEKHRSLRAAAASMSMAYSKAWTITKHAERQLGFPLLHSSTGGKGGGGATLRLQAAELHHRRQRRRRRRADGRGAADHGGL